MGSILHRSSRAVPEGPSRPTAYRISCRSLWIRGTPHEYFFHVAAAARKSDCPCWRSIRRLVEPGGAPESDPTARQQHQHGRRNCSCPSPIDVDAREPRYGSNCTEDSSDTTDKQPI